tara:strand:- start:389 stop:601 length:213 start_codon:yes stop_codon:yes gene_type:complete
LNHGDLRPPRGEHRAAQRASANANHERAADARHAMPGAAVTGVIPNGVISCEETTSKDKQFNTELAGIWS